MSALARAAAGRAPAPPQRRDRAQAVPQSGKNRARAVPSQDDQRRSPLRVVGPAPAAGRRDRRLLSAIGGGLLFAATLTGNVGVQAQTTQGQFELERLEAMARRRQADYQELRLQVAELEAPQRILERAHQLGMIEPARVTYLTPTAKTSTPGPAAAAADRVSTSEAAQGWSDVKPHLDRQR